MTEECDKELYQEFLESEEHLDWELYQQDEESDEK